jgi:immune inhibitor A
LRKYIVALSTLGLCICVCLAFDIFLASILSIRNVIPGATEEPGSTPTLLRPPVSTDAVSTEELLRETPIEARDLYSLTERLKHVGPVPRVVNETVPQFEIGQRETFWINDEELSDTYLSFEAVLRYATPHVYMWVQAGLNVDQRGIEASANEFENRIYPTNHQYFGSEWSPGVDNDVHVHILNAYLPSVGGYYSSNDEYPQSVNQFSNQKEMMYINVGYVAPGDEAYNSTIAHEFEHMIHWNVDPNEDTWVGEGSAQTAEALNGYEVWLDSFLAEPDTQLTAWADEISEAGIYYDASFLFVYYFSERFGPEVMRDLTATPADGMAGIDEVLRNNGQGLTSEDVFADWLVANVVNDSNVADGRYGYEGIDLPQSAAIDHSHRRYPDSRTSTVHQYAADYVELLPGRGDLTIEFDGSTEVQLLENEPHSGVYEWWSNRADVSDMTLTREFDLTGLDSASLVFWTWYDIEDDYDYAYVEISTDGGQNWDALQGRYTTDTNPYGNSLGHAYTGTSGGGERPEWVREEIDLLPYVGRKAMLRFEYVTDDMYNAPGFCVDDISIPELGYEYDAEVDGGWQPQGFVRSTNVVPQDWLVQVITLGAETEIHEVPIDEARQGRIVVQGMGTDLRRAILVISALARSTTEMATYQYRVSVE